jgi:quercetin dioxygenase-like cupin family protein
MKIQKILLSIVAIAVIGATASAASRQYTSPPTTVLNLKTGDIPRETPLEATVLVATIAPGNATVWHAHDAPVFAYTESGSYDVDFGDGRPSKSVPAGKAIMEPTHTVIRARNPSPTLPAKIVLFQLRSPSTPFLRPLRHE